MHQTVATWMTSIACLTAPGLGRVQSGATYSIPRAPLIPGREFLGALTGRDDRRLQLSFP